MSLADELAEAVAETQVWQLCGVAKAIVSLDDDDAAALVEWMARPKGDVPSSRIAKVLQGRGIKIADNTVSRHRRGQCRCELG